MNKLLTRSVDPDFPSRDEYMLTQDCRSFIHIIMEMIAWDEQHNKKITEGLPRGIPVVMGVEPNRFLCAFGTNWTSRCR